MHILVHLFQRWFKPSQTRLSLVYTEDQASYQIRKHQLQRIRFLAFWLLLAGTFFYGLPITHAADYDYRDRYLEPQIPVSHPDFGQYQADAENLLWQGDHLCAAFINRLIMRRFGFMPYGHAWTMQSHPANQALFDHVWQLGTDQYNRDPNLSLHDYQDRIDHYKQLYRALNRDPNPIGVLGFVYQYSTFKQTIYEHPEYLAQTHVQFLAGRQDFTVTNVSTRPMTVGQILETEYGKIHDFERTFVQSIVDLTHVLARGESYVYSDYLVQEYFRSVQDRSLLAVFLQKHRNNRVTPLLRPVSYSGLNNKITQELQRQINVYAELPEVRFVSGKAYQKLKWDWKTAWTERLHKEFTLPKSSSDWKHLQRVPVPVSVIK